MEVADCERFAETEVIDVNDELLGDFAVDSFNFELTHGELELTTGFHTFCVTFDLDGNFHHDGLLGIYLEEIDVENCILDRLESEIFHHGLTGLAVEFEVDFEDVGSVDELAYVFSFNGDVGSDHAALCVEFHELLTGFECAVVGEFHEFATIEDSGDLTFVAKSLYSLLAEFLTGFGLEIEFLHFLKMCY